VIVRMDSCQGNPRLCVQFNSTGRSLLPGRLSDLISPTHCHFMNGVMIRNRLCTSNWLHCSLRRWCVYLLETDSRV